MATVTPRFRRARTFAAVLSCVGVLAAAMSAGCAARKGARSPDGEVSDIEANSYIRRAIRQSSEGVILLPSQRAERVYELPRLNEIAQSMRNPAARCFLARAIETMEPKSEGERGFDHVPEGQLKARVRIAPSGEVLRTEVLESGFVDEKMEPCIQKVLQEQRWPPNKTGNSHFIDVVYWVSLGFQRGLDTPQAALHLRREQVSAGRRAKACLQGRVDAGRYEVGGLNLIDREGSTMVNRVDSSERLPQPIRACIATALREIRLPRDPEAFVRPVAPRVAFVVDREGTVGVEGERWLALIETEERARRAAEREALRAAGEDLGEPESGPDQVDELPRHRPVQAGAGVASGSLAETTDAPPADDSVPVRPPPGGAEPPATAPTGESATPADPPATDPAADPAKPGLRLDLGGRKSEPR